VSSIAIQRLGTVLQHVDAMNPSHCLYLSFEQRWTVDSDCLVLATSDIDGTPDAAVENGMEYVIGLDAVQDAIVNAAQQVPVLTAQQRFDAFVFYYDNDAFLVL
jgi:hypothetical protein